MWDSVITVPIQVAHLWKGFSMTEWDGPASMDAHCSRAQQRKRDCTSSKPEYSWTQSNCGEIVVWPNIYKKTIASFPMPPVVAKTRGVKEACSTSLMRSPYSLFCCSWRRYSERMLDWQQLRALGSKTLTSKKALCRCPQKPFAWISALASSWWLADG